MKSCQILEPIKKKLFNSSLLQILYPFLTLVPTDCNKLIAHTKIFYEFSFHFLLTRQTLKKCNKFKKFFRSY